VENEIAFYGGTFTSLPVALIRELLEATAPYLDKGLFAGIRVSTRPDAIDTPICELIAGYRVKTVELGAQSMNDGVLRLSGRGHTAAETVNSARILRERGFRVGLQIMPGLPGD
jgi:histone acetyltransferase (RNA polymerase elongator complex component)